MILRDPVHGLVAFDGADARVVPALLDTREFQRLRDVRALGVASMAFPGAEHSRFTHGIGAARVMARLLARVEPLAAELGVPLSPQDHDDAMAAALLHDLGHGPLSHLFEEVFPGMPTHEAWSSAAILDPDSGVHRVLASRDAGMPARVERLVHGIHPIPLLARAVSGTLDVDRCDYLLRDSHMTGARYGLFDLDWLLRALAVERTAAGARLAVDGAKGLPAIEGYFLARLFMYQQVYFHKTTRAAEAVLRGVFRRVADLAGEGRGPSVMPPTLARLARGEALSSVEYLRLDDTVLWSAVSAWCDDPDPVLASLARRCRARALFKTAPLDGVDSAYDDEIADAMRACVRAAGFDDRYHASLDVVEVVPFESASTDDEALRVLHAHRAPEPIERASFVLSRLAGTSLVRRHLIFPAEARDAVTKLVASRRDGA